MESIQTERTATDVLKTLADKGFTGNFSAEPSGKVRLDRDTVVPATELQVEALYRFEGRTNPEDQSVVVAACFEGDGDARRGALLLSYGPAGSAEDAEVLRLLQDRDEDSPRPDA